MEEKRQKPVTAIIPPKKDAGGLLNSALNADLAPKTAIMASEDAGAEKPVLTVEIEGFSSEGKMSLDFPIKEGCNTVLFEQRDANDE